MASFPSYNVFITLAILHVFLISSSAKLSENYYKDSFPQLYETVSKVVQDAIKEERRMGASLLRLHFHDCFVTGCDGSLLLDDTPSFTGEKTARPNNNSARGFEVIDKIKKAVEKVHRGVVSCADILAIAAKASVCILGGPDWKVQLGRKDALTASLVAANNGSIPAPTSNLTALINRFKALGLSKTDLVALSGSHTIGQARCTNFRAHIYNDTDVEASFANERKRNCPGTSGSGDNNLAPLDLQTPNDFDNTYFGNLVNKTGLLHSDQQLFSGNSKIDQIVRKYSNDKKTFFDDFAKAMVKMGNISPLTGDEGEIRTNCRKVNT